MLVVVPIVVMLVILYVIFYLVEAEYLQRDLIGHLTVTANFYSSKYSSKV